MDRLDQAFERIDALNATDPNVIEVDGEPFPKELAYGRRMSARLDAYAPTASDALRIAARAQHIQRWAIPRSDYPMDRKGYHRWRQTLYGMHADLATAIAGDVGYAEPVLATIDKLLRKKGLKTDPTMQTLEDVICLVFLEHYWGEFAAKHDDEKLVRIVQKTWRKMSERAHREALKLPFDERSQRILERATQ